MEIVVISGSLPKGVEHSFYGEMVDSVWEGAKIIIDTEKENMLEAVKNREIFMVKPNIHELEDFANMIVHSNNDIVQASKSYIKLGVKNVLVSMGAEGAVLTNGVDSYFCKSASVAVNSTVGAGDSMVAATCVGLTYGVPEAELLKRAVAAGTAAVTTSGTNLFYKDKYNEIYTRIKTEKI
jgi:1-phosphofructokinase family hexose kinase